MLTRDIIAAYGGLDALTARVVAFVAALEAHKLTVDVPAPTEDPLIDAIARAGGMDAVEIEPEPAPPAPPEPPADPKAAALTALAAKRYEVETGGIIVNGVAVATDDRSKTLLLGARLEALMNPATSLRWKTSDGFVPLSGSQIITISGAVRAHVQACFDREAELAARIAAADDPVAVDISSGWPA
jgi:hypothetical protein